MHQATAQIAQTHYITAVSNHRGHQWTVDEPKELGGTDTGPSPDEMLASALATCASITMRMYADRKQWPVEEIRVTVGVERTEAGTTLHKQVHITGQLSPEETERLKAVGDKCPVHKSLLNPITIISVIE